MPNKDGTGPDGQNRKFMKRRLRNQNDCGENQNQSRNFRNRRNSSFRNQNSDSIFDKQINERV